MRILVIPTIALASLIDAPVAAQIAGRPNHGPVVVPDVFLGNGRLPGPDIGRELVDIRGRISDARDSGAISGRAARGLRREARLIGILAGRYARDGLSDAERGELTVRALYLRDAVGRTPRAQSGR